MSHGHLATPALPSGDDWRVASLSCSRGFLHAGCAPRLARTRRRGASEPRRMRRRASSARASRRRTQTRPTRTVGVRESSRPSAHKSEQLCACSRPRTCGVVHVHLEPIEGSWCSLPVWKASLSDWNPIVTITPIEKVEATDEKKLGACTSTSASIRCERDRAGSSSMWKLTSTAPASSSSRFHRRWSEVHALAPSETMWKDARRPLRWPPPPPRRAKASEVAVPSGTRQAPVNQRPRCAPLRRSPLRVHGDNHGPPSSPC